MEIDVTTAFGDSQLDPRVTAGIVALWDERSTREVVEQAASFQLNDSAPLVTSFRPLLTTSPFFHPLLATTKAKLHHDEKETDT